MTRYIDLHPELALDLAEGRHYLPAGFVPLVYDPVENRFIGIDPEGRWVSHHPVGESAPKFPQKEEDVSRRVWWVLLEQFGGINRLAKSVEKSPRTVEGWKRGRHFSTQAAYSILQAILRLPR